MGKDDMNPNLKLHQELTEKRIVEYKKLFGNQVVAAFPATKFGDMNDCIIDIFVFESADAHNDAYTLVTNGMSDTALTDARLPGKTQRCELVRYVHSYTDDDIQRLYSDAWLPHFDKFILLEGDTIDWSVAPPQLRKLLRLDTPWRNSLFLPSVVERHSEFLMKLSDGTMSFLWDVPISDEELAYKREHGIDAFLKLMDQHDLPWIFDAKTRKHMVSNGAKKP